MNSWCFAITHGRWYIYITYNSFSSIFQGWGWNHLGWYDSLRMTWSPGLGTCRSINQVRLSCYFQRSLLSQTDTSCQNCLAIGFEAAAPVEPIVSKKYLKKNIWENTSPRQKNLPTRNGMHLVDRGLTLTASKPRPWPMSPHWPRNREDKQNRSISSIRKSSQ